MIARARSCILSSALLAAAGCASAPSFNLASLQPTTEEEQVTLTGHFELSGLQFRLYPGGHSAKAPCLSGALTSLAGVPTPEFSNRTMTLTGHLLRADSPEAANVPNTCNAPVILLATDVTAP